MGNFMLSLAALGGMVGVHLFSTHYALMQGRYRRTWLSFAGGVSVAYVFVRILPELSKEEETIAALVSEQAPFLDYHIYLVSLFGLLFFYGLDRAAVAGRRSQNEEEREDPGQLIYAIHLGAFAAVNLLVGYLLWHRDVVLVQDLGLFAIAMILYFFVVDENLSAVHHRAFERTGRYVLATSVIIGWLIGLFTPLPDAYVALFFAFLAGGVILNVLNQELPSRREGSYTAFVLGAVSYGALLVAI